VKPGLHKAVHVGCNPNPSVMKFFIYSGILLIMTFSSCYDPKSLYIKNATKSDLEIIYDDRVYRSQLDTNRTLSTIRIKSDSTFFLGPASDLSNIWPDYIQINSNHDTIILIGRRAINSMINDNTGKTNFITIK
jgi:hypothetical protein